MPRMPDRTTRRHRAGGRRILPAVLLGLALLGAACGNASGTQGGGTTSAAHRPSSPAKLAIISPKDGQVINGSHVPLKTSLKGARIVQPTTQHITPTTGHLHVYLDNRIISMNYGLDETIPDVPPGNHVIRVEFVASDHLPFNPRVFTAVTFTVHR